MALGIGIMRIYETSTAVNLMFVGIIPGLGAGLLYAGVMYAVQASSDPEEGATCLAMVSFLRLFGQAFGVAIGGVVFQNQIATRLAQSHQLATERHDLARLASNLVGIIQEAPRDSLMRTELIDAVQVAFQVLLYVLCGLSAFVLALSAFIKEFDINQRHFTEQGYREKLASLPNSV